MTIITSSKALSQNIKMRLSIEEVQKRLNDTHRGEVSIVAETFSTHKGKSQFIDIEFGAWTASVASVLRGTRHPERAKKVIKNKSINKIKEALLNKFGDLILLIEDTFITFSQKSEFIDIEYGAWKALPKNVINGFGHPLRAMKGKSEKLSYNDEEIQNLLNTIHGGKIILLEKYKGMLEIHDFNHVEHGLFSAYIGNVIHKKTSHIIEAVFKRKETSYIKYGVMHPMQTSHIATLCAKSNKRSLIINHWKTNEELVCVASYEIAVVNWLNDSKINFEWQQKAFFLPDKNSYRPDLYLVDEDKWVEIKGIFRRNGKKKWDWFHKEFPNSELWDMSKLKEMKLI